MTFDIFSVISIICSLFLGWKYFSGYGLTWVDDRDMVTRNQYFRLTNKPTQRDKLRIVLVAMALLIIGIGLYFIMHT